VGIAANLYSMDEKSPKQLGYNIGRTVIAAGGRAHSNGDLAK